MRLIWESIKCYTDDFQNKKMFFLTHLDSINFLQKYFENFGQKFEIFSSNFVHCTLYNRNFCKVYKIWGKNLKFLTKIFEIFLEEVNWIQKCKKKHFFVFKVICVTFSWFSKYFHNDFFFDIFYFLSEMSCSKNDCKPSVIKKRLFQNISLLNNFSR